MIDDACNGCGSCCDPVVLPFTQREIMGLLPVQMEHPEDRDWVLHDLVPITRAEGLRRAAYLRGGVTAYAMDGNEVLLYSHFYECRHFDTDTRQCGIYDDRPTTCRDYPLYDEPVLDPRKAVPAWCGYLPDPQPVPWPTRR